MSALAAEPGAPSGTDWDSLVRGWEATDAPEGWTVEIIEGVITVAPPPSKDHNLIAARLQRQLYRAIPDDWNIFQTQGVAVPSKRGLYVPDLLIVPEKEFAQPGLSIPGEKAELVVEITSESNANHDRVSKVNGYAAASVPLYLLLDSWHSARPTFTLYGSPEDGTYRTLQTGVFGDELKLPAPFGCVIDTSVLPVS